MKKLTSAQKKTSKKAAELDCFTRGRTFSGLSSEAKKEIYKKLDKLNAIVDSFYSQDKKKIDWAEFAAANN